MAEEEVTDEEILAELEEYDTVPLQYIPNLEIIENKEVSNERLTKCLDCPYMKKLKCTKNWNLIHVMARAKDATCPIGEW
jgi:hypothetical protein